MMRNRGYTLLEILLSLTILTVLGLVFVATIQKLHERNQIRTAASQMNAITNAAINYYKMYTEWPSTVTTLNPLLNKDLSCSVWKNTSGCTRYQITSQTNAHYFALAITPPNTAIATHLVTQLPSAYQSGTTVTAYVTTFSGFKVQKQIPPPGVLLSANNQQLNGVCNTTDSSITHITYKNPFDNCISSSVTPTKSYGLIDINAQPKNAPVAQNVFAIIRGGGSLGASFTGATPPTCPAGTKKTMILLPVGVRTTIVANGQFRYVSSTASNSGGWLQATFMPFVGNVSTYSKSENVSAAAGDIVCLPANAMSGWPYQ